MINIEALTEADIDEVVAIITGYVADEQYVVAMEESEGYVAITMRLEARDTPYVKRWRTDETARRLYLRLLQEAMCYGAYEGDQLVGIALAEIQSWNNTFWIWEFGVAESHRRRGIGRRLMEFMAEKGREAGMRTILCETQSTNVPAIRFYRRLGFAVEGIDISYYTNEDALPDGEVAVFMKRRLA